MHSLSCEFEGTSNNVKCSTELFIGRVLVPFLAPIKAKLHLCYPPSSAVGPGSSFECLPVVIMEEINLWSQHQPHKGA